MTSRSSKSLAEAKPRHWQTGLVVCMNRYPLGALGKLPSWPGVVGRACGGDTQVPLPLLVRIQSQPELYWHIHDPPKERLRLAEALPDRSPLPSLRLLRITALLGSEALTVHSISTNHFFLPFSSSQPPVSLVKLSTFVCSELKLVFRKFGLTYDLFWRSWEFSHILRVN